MLILFKLIFNITFCQTEVATEIIFTSASNIVISSALFMGSILYVLYRSDIVNALSPSTYWYRDPVYVLNKVVEIKEGKPSVILNILDADVVNKIRGLCYSRFDNVPNYKKFLTIRLDISGVENFQLEESANIIANAVFNIPMVNYTIYIPKEVVVHYQNHLGYFITLSRSDFVSYANSFKQLTNINGANVDPQYLVCLKEQAIVAVPTIASEALKASPEFYIQFTQHFNDILKIMLSFS